MNRVVKGSIVALLILIVVFLMVFNSSPQDDLESLFTHENVPISSVRSVITRRLSKRDPKDVYEQIKKLVSQQSYGQAHVGMHVFGESLFRTHGLDGVGICDDSYGFGCYHGFFGTAIAAEGSDILDDFDRACIAQYGELGLGCQHGIGHGLGEYFGPLRLQDQLAACVTLSWKGTYFGCSGGVFMEYNFPTTVEENGGTTTTRTFDQQHPYTPCTDISERFRQSCYLELASWYVQVLSRDWKQIDGLCGALFLEKERMACYLGAGVAAVPEYNYSVEEVLKICLAFATQEGKDACFAGASWSFFAHPDHRGKAIEMCASSADPAQCERDADLIHIDS